MPPAALPPPPPAGPLQPIFGDIDQRPTMPAAVAPLIPATVIQNGPRAFVACLTANEVAAAAAVHPVVQWAFFTLGPQATLGQLFFPGMAPPGPPPNWRGIGDVQALSNAPGPGGVSFATASWNAMQAEAAANWGTVFLGNPHHQTNGIRIRLPVLPNVPSTRRRQCFVLCLLCFTRAAYTAAFHPPLVCARLRIFNVCFHSLVPHVALGNANEMIRRIYDFFSRADLRTIIPGIRASWWGMPDRRKVGTTRANGPVIERGAGPPHRELLGFNNYTSNRHLPGSLVFDEQVMGDHPSPANSPAWAVLVKALLSVAAIDVRITTEGPFKDRAVSHEDPLVYSPAHRALLAVVDPGHDGTDWVAVANTGAYNFAGTSSLLQHQETTAALRNQAAQDLAACGVGPQRLGLDANGNFVANTEYAAAMDALMKVYQ